MRLSTKLKKINFSFQILILLPFIIFLIILRLFKKIQIIEIETRAIGHMSLPMEVFLCEISENIHSNKCLNIAFKNNFVANDFLFSKLKINFFMMPRIILEPIFFLFNYKYIYELLGKYFVSNYRHWTKVHRR